MNCGLSGAELWEQQGRPRPTVFHARFVKPLPEAQLLELAATHKHLLVIEENMLSGGFSSAILEFYNQHGLADKVTRLGLPDSFIEHGPVKILREKIGLSGKGVLAALQAFEKD